MTMLVHYPTKKVLKENVGKPLSYSSPGRAPTATGFSASIFRASGCSRAARLRRALPRSAAVFAAPFIIMRNGVRGRRIERRRAQMVMVAR